MPNDAEGAVKDLLQHMIRNQCVNDGSARSGQELRNVAALSTVLEGPGLDLQIYEPSPGRASIVARIEGQSRESPSLVLLGHTDVVPARAEEWTRDPFGGELVDGEIWGRGAIDMLNLTSSMAVAFRRLADSGFRPLGHLVFIGVADEESLGTHGAKWLTQNATEHVFGDYLVTEAGGFPLGPPNEPRLPITSAEKGSWWCTITVHGTPGHGSQPLRTDNAVVKAAEVVQRLTEFQPSAEIHQAWRGFVEGLALPPEFAEPLLDAQTVDQFCRDLPELGLARLAHASTHTTLAPTVVRGGTKVNVIPDKVEIEVDIRVLPGWGPDEVDDMLRNALGDMYDAVQIDWACRDQASSSPTATPLWKALEKVAGSVAYPGARCVPFLMPGVTDARFFRKLGTIAYGCGLFSRKLGFEDYATMFHGIDERVDVESLGLSEQLWEGLARELLG